MSREFNIKCPIKCGRCCRESWQETGVCDPIITMCRTLGKRGCPNYTDDGCKLPRKRRPYVCVGYLCEPAIGLLIGQFTRRTALRWHDRGHWRTPLKPGWEEKLMAVLKRRGHGRIKTRAA